MLPEESPRLEIPDVMYCLECKVFDNEEYFIYIYEPENNASVELKKKIRLGSTIKKRLLIPFWRVISDVFRGFVMTGLVVTNLAIIVIGMMFFAFLFTIISPKEVVNLHGQTAIYLMEEAGVISPSTEFVESPIMPRPEIAVSE